MLIDWFTVIAQVINFLILVWLLKRFLYRPILNAIDAREKRIAAKIADAAAKEAKAQKERDEYQHRNEVFDKERAARMNQVLEAAKTERAQLLDAARQESDDLRARLEQALRNEQRNLNEDISRRAREEVFAIVRKALFDLAGTSLEERMTDIFLDRLRALNAAQIAEWKSALKSSPAPLRVRTAFKLPAQQCTAIETVIAELLGKEKQVEFDIAPDRVSGIEISANGQKIAWSIADYLDSLARSVDELLKTRTETKSLIR
ncbi:MAG: F0F1 ATP synthase subunit B [Thiobacillus sp.]